MKKLIIILAAIILLACEKEEKQYEVIKITVSTTSNMQPITDTLSINIISYWGDEYIKRKLYTDFYSTTIKKEVKEQVEIIVISDNDITLKINEKSCIKGNGKIEYIIN